MKARKSSAVAIFIGALLIIIFAVGLACSKNPDIFRQKYRYDYSLEQFCAFCVNFWLPAGIIGFPTFLISLIISLIREKKDSSGS
ncbi:MAG: hypothetical protein IKQ45_05395 [Clostridia bacterium]|nr:hypothetical protein [Clostridia bacterium]